MPLDGVTVKVDELPRQMLAGAGTIVQTGLGFATTSAVQIPVQVFASVIVATYVFVPTAGGVTVNVAVVEVVLVWSGTPARLSTTV